MGFIEEQELSRLEEEKKQDLKEIDDYRESIKEMLDRNTPLFTTPLYPQLSPTPLKKEKKGFFRKIMYKLAKTAGYGTE